MLPRLRAHSLGQCHDQQCGVDAAGPGEHRMDEALVPGNIDKAKRIGVGITKVDGDAAPLFLGQTIGVHTGQRFDQRGFSVIDVTGRADDHGRCLISGAETAAAEAQVKPRRASWTTLIGPMKATCNAGVPSIVAAARRPNIQIVTVLARS